MQRKQNLAAPTEKLFPFYPTEEHGDMSDDKGTNTGKQNKTRGFRSNFINDCVKGKQKNVSLAASAFSKALIKSALEECLGSAIECQFPTDIDWHPLITFEDQEGSI